ncbi:hypothetical protein QYF36_020357 [Acer negundo]|nr:hypothetical protein QYF36_020357 [Acer negundo]
MFAQGDLALGASLGNNGKWGMRNEVISKPILDKRVNKVCLKAYKFVSFSIGQREMALGADNALPKKESVKLDIDKSKSIGYREACDGGGPNSGLEEEQKSGIHVINGSGKDSEEFSSNFYIESCSVEVEFALLSKNPKGRESYLPVKCHNMKELWALQ